MDLKKAFAFAACMGIMLGAPAVATAKVSAAEAATLGGDRLTCNGAEKAGTKGGVAQWTGKFQGTWPGLKAKSGYVPGPYAGEQPLLKISAANMAQYADRLTDGEKALMTKYPQSYWMRSEEHTSELQSLMRISYAVFCLKKKK